MKTITSFLSAAGLFLASSSYANDIDPYHDGWISHANDQQLEICYPHAPPPKVGESVQILRTSYITANKGPVRQQFQRSGTARITTAASIGCVSAELIDGSAKRSDHVRAAR